MDIEEIKYLLELFNTTLIEFEEDIKNVRKINKEIFSIRIL